MGPVSRLLVPFSSILLKFFSINFIIYVPINVFPVPGGPYISATFLLKAELKAIAC